MLKALSGPLPTEGVTREEWNGEGLSPEVGGSQECMVLDSAVPQAVEMMDKSLLSQDGHPHLHTPC